jgi:hypothetical protein
VRAAAEIVLFRQVRLRGFGIGPKPRFLAKPSRLLRKTETSSYPSASTEPLMDCRAKRLECAELAPAFKRPTHCDSASKLDALQTLRAIRLRLCRSTSSAASVALLERVPEFLHLYLRLPIMVFIDLLQSPFQSLQSRLPLPRHRTDDLRHSSAEHGCANRSSRPRRPAFSAADCGCGHRRLPSAYIQRPSLAAEKRVRAEKPRQSDLDKHG